MEPIGREAELGVIARALEHVRDGAPAVVWVEGEAGSGKSTLVDRAVAMFRESGNQLGHRTVWRAAGDGEEQVIEHGVADHLLRQARTVYGSAPARPERPSRSAELLEIVAKASDRGPVMLALDDVHWCDHASRQAIRFLLRRLEGLRVLVMAAHRPMGQWPADVRRAVGNLRTEVIELGGLTVSGVRQFMAARDVPLTPRAGRRLHDHTGGNPQLLRALADELGALELASGEGPLPAPRYFVDWVHHAYAIAPAPVRQVVAALAVLGAPASLRSVSTLTGITQPQGAVDDAIGLGLVRLVVHGGERLADVGHALVRSAVNDAMSFTQFSQFHERAAALTTDPLRRMLHRLQASSSTDASLVAEAVDLAEEQARAGASLASARLLVLVGRLLPVGAQRHEAWVTATERLLTIGEVRWAERLLADVAAERHRDATAQELLVTSHLALQLGQGGRAEESALRAWELGRDPRVVTGAAELLAFLGMDAGDGEAATTWAARAIEASDTRLAGLRWAGTVLTSGWALRGDLAPAREFLQLHMARLEGTASEPDIRLGLALTQLWSGALEEASETLGHLLRVLADGSAVLRSTARLARAELDFRLGCWDEVLETTDSELALVDEGWESRTAPMTLAVGAYVCAARGEEARSRDFIERAEALLEAGANLPARTMVSVARGRLAWAFGDPAGAVAALAPLQADARTNGIPEGVHAWRADLAEALVALGSLDDAAALLTDLAGTGHDPHASCGLFRARAALAVARGHVAEAQELLEHAVAAGPARSGTFVHARAELALGALLRRRGERRRAADHLEAALARFESLRAAPFARLARQERELCALRRGQSERSTTLTPAEEAVARLAVAGQKNREIAQSLTVSIKTVETHMGRIFTKLGVRHRVELVTALAEREASVTTTEPGAEPPGGPGSPAVR